MRWQRLRRMSAAELVGRAQQQAAKWRDRAGLAPAASGRLPHLFDLEQWRDAFSRRFFAGADDTTAAPLLARRFPEAVASIVADADSVRGRRFDLLGYRGLFFGDPIDWHLEPVSGRRAPQVHWTRLDPLDPTAVGDSKVVWELNRHQWLLRLGAAYRLTADERYAGTFARAVEAWLQANPPGMGINWASSLEVALRLMAWCWALALFRPSPVLSPALQRRLAGAIAAHAAHVERYLSHYFSPNTHLTGEALGLFYAGVLFPALPGARRWSALGARLLVEQSGRQIPPDGVYFEQSTCYQRYTAEIYLHFLILARGNGVAVPADVVDRVQRLLDFLVAVRRPDGTMPMIGDADGGALLPLVPRAPDDFRGLFSTAAAFFGRADCAWAAGGAAPETLWLLGAEGVRAVDALAPTPPAPGARVFVDGGYVVMQSAAAPDAHQLVFDVGPLGCSVSGGHGHADLLSLQCSAFGEPYLVDPGTDGYTGDARWRNFFRSSAAHSTVRVDGLEQADPAGPFAWTQRPCAHLRRWVSTAALDVAEAEHDAYRRLPDPVRHRRRVIFVKPRYWVIVDDFDGAAEHRLELRFQLAPMGVTLDPALWACARRQQRGLLIRPFATVPIKGEVHEGEVDPIQGWVAPDYGQRRPAPVVVYSTVTALPARIATLLLPTADASAPPPAVSLRLDDAGMPAALAFDDPRHVVFMDGFDHHQDASGGA